MSYVSSNTAPMGVDTPAALAKGELITGGVGATNTPAGPGVPATTTPTATVFTAFSVVPGNSGFFVNPAPFYQANVSTFTNTPTQFQATDTGFTISQGGGATNFLPNLPTNVPEPISLALLGSMVTVAVFVRARKHT